MLLHLYREDQDSEFLPAVHEMADHLLRKGTSECGVPYRDGTPLYLVDTLGIVDPFLICYGSYFDNEDATRLAVRQLRVFLDRAMDPVTGLPWHGFRDRPRSALLGSVGWGRGVGWLLMGLADVAASLVQAGKADTGLGERLREVCATVIRYQRPDGGWGSCMQDPYSPYDSSATAMIGYGLARARAAGVTTTGATRSLMKAIDSLASHTDQRGILGAAEGPCNGLRHYSDRYGPASYAQGMALAAACLANTMETGDPASSHAPDDGSSPPVEGSCLG
jgi:unsaturated rhamnogalacturonyl hydrolase